MGKKKNKNKVSGAVKTAAKTEKKLANKLKKELANLGEEDIAKVIAEIEREEAKRSTAAEKTLTGPPSPRAYATLTPHPNNNELVLFGGEYHDGRQTLVYNELLIFNPDKSTWRQIKAPAGPPPRSAHQAVTTQANKGELWVFGGEFTSPSETQFHHYRDLWCFSFAEKKWEKVIAPNGPSSRSGHRMCLLGRKIMVYGGYHDDGRDCKYFDDLYSFCLDTRTWTKIVAGGKGPSARSACVMLPAGNDGLIIYGGFSRIRDGKTEHSYTHNDMFRLNAKGEGWVWRSVGGTGGPARRAGQGGGSAGGRGYVFGGVTDVEETEEDIRGEMSADLHMLDLESCRWHDVTLRGDVTAPSQAQAQGSEMEVAPVQEVTVVTDEIFTMKLGGAKPPSESIAPPTAAEAQTKGGPLPRMGAMLAIQRSVLYVYGGVLERDEKQFYLGDMYSLDLHKLNEWRTIIPLPKLPEWLGSDSEYESGSDSDDDSDESDEE